MFPGYVILAAISIVGNSEVTIPAGESKDIEISYLNTQNYDMNYTYLGFENINSSTPGKLTFGLANDEKTKYYYEQTLTVSENDTLVTDKLTSSASTALINNIQISNGGSDETTVSVDKVYLLAAENSENAGAEIIDGITAGLGLMSPIANEFLTGFSTIFWDSTANSGAGGLTTFGNFALIFMGVSITFAVVKLALNLIRGKTGA